MRRWTQRVPGEALPQSYLIAEPVRLLRPRRRRREIRRDLGYVLVWTALATIMLTVAVLAATG